MLARVSLLLCCSVHIVRILQILRNLRILGYFCSSASVFILPAHDAGIRFPFRLHICNRCQSYTSVLGVSVHVAPLSKARRDHLATIAYITLMCVILSRVPDERSRSALGGESGGIGRFYDVCVICATRLPNATAKIR